MSFGIKVSILIVATGMFILGVLGNGFIGLVNCVEWFRTGKVSSADFILTSLALARITQLLLILLDSFILGLAPHLYATGKLAKVVTILWALTNQLTIWIATCLSIFYFLKIGNFSHSFFMWLKWRVNSVVLLLFLGSFLLQSLNLLMHDAINELWMSSYRVHEINMTVHLKANEMFYLRSLLTLTYIIPFFLSLMSLLLLFLSLVRHTKNLQLNQTRLGDSSTEAHKWAMKMVTMFLLLFTIYIISILTACWIFINLHTFQVKMFLIITFITFPSGHAFIIIFGNSKLRQIALRLLWPLNYLRKAQL